MCAPRAVGHILDVVVAYSAHLRSVTGHGQAANRPYVVRCYFMSERARSFSPRLVYVLFWGFCLATDLSAVTFYPSRQVLPRLNAYPDPCSSNITPL